MMHSEDLKVQRQCLETFRGLAQDSPKEWQERLKNNYNYALRHAKIIERFGRYPHRNAILGETLDSGRDRFPKTTGFVVLIFSPLDTNFYRL